MDRYDQAAATRHPDLREKKALMHLPAEVRGLVVPTHGRRHGDRWRLGRKRIAATFYAANTDDSAPSDRPSFTYGLR